MTLLGIYSVFASKERGASAAVRHPYLRCVGAQRDASGPGRASFRFEPAEGTSVLLLFYCTVLLLVICLTVLWFQQCR